MPKIDEARLGLYLSNLMDAKLGKLRNWQVPDVRNTIGPFDPSVFTSFDDKRRRIVSECQIELARYTDDNILILVDPQRDDPNEIGNQWSKFLREEINGLRKRMPVWFAGGFGHPDYQADFEYWGQMETYALHEALLLSVGVEPKHIGEEAISKAVRETEQFRLWPPMEYLVRRHELFVRKFPSAGFGPMSVSPTFLIEWFGEIELAVHPEFLDALQRRSAAFRKANGIEDRNERDPKKTRPDQREIDKIAQLFTAMAIDSLGYDPNARRSPIPREITDLAASMGLDVSDDTVRKYLKLGARFLPDDWKPD